MKSEKGGLSPLVRGKRDICAITSVSCGSIPACAGETIVHSFSGPVLRVYPRLCGGNDDGNAKTYTAWGLSPLVRGKLPVICAASPFHGSIPACAGETIHSDFFPIFTGVYPRLCGGNYSSLFIYFFRRGLSPLVRGKHGIVSCRRTLTGSIPACAGETHG